MHFVFCTLLELRSCERVGLENSVWIGIHEGAMHYIDIRFLPRQLLLHCLKAPTVGALPSGRRIATSM